MVKIVVDSNIPFIHGALEGVATPIYIDGDKITRRVIEDADALIIRTRTLCNKDLLEGTRVKYIATATIGHDHIDTEYCLKNNIRWSNAPGCNAPAVCQYILSAISRLYIRGKLKEKKPTLGIIGAGNIGGRLSEAANAIGFKVLLNDPPREEREGSGEFTDIDDLLSDSDIISINTPLNLHGRYKTFQMAGNSFFDRIKKGAWFINTARGPVMQSSAVVKAVQTNRIKGAVVDVWENEPVTDNELRRAAEIATPHIAGYSVEGKAMGTAMSVRAVSRFFDLGMDNWYPKKLPPPPHPFIKTDNCIENELIYRAILHSYNIESDSIRLKSDPEQFELQRNNYPVRREFGAYTVMGRDISHGNLKIFKRLGFKIDH